MFSRPCALMLLAIVLPLAGCDEEREIGEDELKEMAGGELQETVPVSGTVTVGGLPVPGVTIYAYTSTKVGEPAAQVVSKEDGTYCWTTYTMCDGIPPGDYRLAFAYIPDEGKGKNEGEDVLGGKYRDPTKSQHTLQVTSGAPQTDVNFDLEP